MTPMFMTAPCLGKSRGRLRADRFLGYYKPGGAKKKGTEAPGFRGNALPFREDQFFWNSGIFRRSFSLPRLKPTKNVVRRPMTTSRVFKKSFIKKPSAKIYILYFTQGPEFVKYPAPFETLL
jgi:hypothetical protein